MFKLFTNDLRKAVSAAVAETRGFSVKDDLFAYELRLTATEAIAENGRAYIVDSAADGNHSVNVYPCFTDVQAVEEYETLISVFEVEAGNGAYKVEDVSWLF